MTSTTAVTVHLGLLAAQLALLAGPPFAGRNALTVAAVVALAIAAHVAGPASPNAAEAQPYTLLWPIYLATVEKAVTAARSSSSIERCYWRYDRGAYEATRMRPFGLAKCRWAAALLVNPRLVRWNLEAKNVPRPITTPKAKFLGAQLAALVKMALITDFLLQMGIRLFWTPQAGAAAGFADSKYLSIRDPALGWSFFKTLVFACGPYFFMNMQYVAVSLVAVALQLSQPIDFPPLFGNVAHATSVRAFWGQFWHQSIRRPVTTLAYSVMDALNMTRGTTLASYAHIWLAFFISGFMHAQSMALLPRPANITLYEATAGTLYFFLWQALAITAEDFVLWVWKASGRGVEPAAWKSAVGYAWVIVSMWFSLPWAADVMMRLRLTEKSFLGFTVFGPWIHR